ncbi:MAG: hypothetical protein JSR17_10020 [Proteobacteria bacterium]|nr:hypothetical protein [Pseudomonadota bacterium]
MNYLISPESRLFYNVNRVHRINTIPEKLQSMFLENKNEITLFICHAEKVLESMKLDLSTKEKSLVLKEFQDYKKIITTLNIMKMYYKQLTKDVRHIEKFYAKQCKYQHHENLAATLKKHEEVLSNFNMLMKQNTFHSIKNIMENDFVNFILNLEVDTLFKRVMFCIKYKPDWYISI